MIVQVNKITWRQRCFYILLLPLLPYLYIIIQGFSTENVVKMLIVLIVVCATALS